MGDRILHIRCNCGILNNPSSLVFKMYLHFFFNYYIFLFLNNIICDSEEFLNEQND